MGVYEATYGLPTTLPWGMNLGDGIPRHPVCLYETIFLILIWLVLSILNKKYCLANGAAFKIFIVSYLLFRLLLDFIKPHYSFGFGLSTIQVVCIAGLIYYYRYVIHPGKLIQHSAFITV
jgi:prolipoprotein diacylglyceryltransferase